MNAPVSFCFESALAACSARVLLVDLNGVVRFANPALLELFRQVNGRAGKDDLPVDAAGLLGRPLGESLGLSPPAGPGEGPFRLHLDRGAVQLDAVAQPVPDMGGQHCGWVLTWRVAGSRSALLDSLGEVASAVAGGVLEARLQQDAGPADAAVAWAVNAILVGAEASLEPLQQAVDAMAHGDLSAEIPGGYRGATGKVYGKLAVALANVAEAVRQNRAAAVTIAETTTAIADQNSELAARTQAQAQAIEQTGASMQELAATVLDNGQNAREAAGLAERADGLAENGRAAVLQMVEIINAINEGSGRVSGIVDMINEIAFQTNILALNAAVEAARAGEHGRGFSVVATEVRGLAQRSSAAANEIKRLIDTSRALNERGKGLAEDAQGRMGEVVAGVREVSRRIGEISRATHEQGDGIRQASEALGLIDGIAQQNQRLVTGLAERTRVLDMQAAFLAAASQVLHLPETEFTHPRHEAVRALADEAARRVGEALGQAGRAGRLRIDDLFDAQYQPIPGTEPVKYHTRYDAQADRILPGIQEPLLAADSGLIYAICTDRQGYVPTHNERFSRPLTGDYERDLASNRTKRIFEDPVGRQAGEHTEPYRLQTYRRDTGELMFDLSVPIYVEGRHWGGFRIGYRVE